MVIGVVAAFVYHYSYRWQLHRGLDDAVNAVPVHGYCGIWGLLSAALCFAPGRHDALMSAYGVDESSGSCGRGNQFLANLAFAAVVVVWVSECCVILARHAGNVPDGSKKLNDATIGPMKRTETK